MRHNKLEKWGLIKKKIKPHKKKKSLFDDMDDEYLLDKDSYNEWDKLYNNEGSVFDNIDLENEYPQSYEISDQKKTKDKKKKHKSPSLLDDEDDISIVGSNESILTIEQAANTMFNEWKTSMIPAENLFREEDEVKDRALRIAEAFVKKYRVIFVDDALFIYNGVFFSLCKEKDVQRKMLDTYRNEIGKASAAAVLANAWRLLRICVKEVIGEFPVNDNLIVFLNGTLEIDTGIFRDNTPEDYANSALGIVYDHDRREMPNIEYFLSSITEGDEELYELILQVIGYILSNDMKGKKFFYLEGVGNAGKSRFCDLVASFFPDVSSNKVGRLALQDFGTKYSLYNLVNAKLNISEDLPDMPLTQKTVSIIKQISDSDRLEAEAKYVQQFSFKPQCKLLFASNHSLKLKEFDQAFIDRIIYLPFIHSIPKEKQDREILRKMRGELPALANHAIKAYRRLIKNGYIWAGQDRFKPRIDIVGQKDLLINKQSALKMFVDECCGFDEASIVTTSDLHNSYESFCRRNGYEPIMGDRFSREIAGFLPASVTRTKIGNQKRGFKGIKLRFGYD